MLNIKNKTTDEAKLVFHSILLNARYIYSCMTLGFWHLYLLSKFNYSYSVTRLNNLEHVDTISLLCMHIIHRYFQITVSFPAGCYETVTCRQKVKGWTSRCSCCLVCPLSPVLCDLGSCLLETQPGTENPFYPIKWGDPKSSQPIAAEVWV